MLEGVLFHNNLSRGTYSPTNLKEVLCLNLQNLSKFESITSPDWLSQIRISMKNSSHSSDNKHRNLQVNGLTLSLKTKF